tara:strand:+ start:163 stop:393 length:231 start_codon:yes stop_codon:yes gene_type:complete
MNYDDWKLATPDYSDMVSDCCGAETTDVYDIKEESQRTICYECNSYCDTIEDYEYEAIQRENYEEERAEAKRKYNE